MINLSEIRHRLAERLTSLPIKVLRRTGVTPNGLTVFGFLVSVGSAVALAQGYFVAGGLLILFAGAFDLLDGPLARAKGQSTRFGAMLDSSLDRLSEAAVFLGILIYYVNQNNTWETSLPYITFVGSVMVSYLRARAEGLGLKCEVGMFTRAERVIVLAVGLMIGQWLDEALVIALCVLAALAFVTVVQRLIYVRQTTTRQSGI